VERTGGLGIMAAFITRIFKSFVEDVLVQRISDSRAVQQLAVRAVDASKGAKTALENPETIRKFATELWSEVAKQAEKDLANVAVARPSSNTSSTSSSSSSSSSAPFHELDESSLSLEDLLAKNASGKAILFFSASWVIPCTTFSPIFSSIAEESSQPSSRFFSFNSNNNKILFVKIDVGVNQEASAQYGIQSVPTFMAVDGGKVVKIWNGTSETTLRAEVEKLEEKLQ